MPELNVDTLNCVYLALFFVGVGYAIFIVITGGLASIDMPDVNIDIPQIDLPGGVEVPGGGIEIGGPDLPAGGLDAPDIPVSPLSPITAASFITSFGGIGVLALQFFGVDARMSLMWATLGALAISAVMYLFYSQVLIRSQGSSEIHRSDILGLEAEVMVPIGVDTPGQVSYITKSGRMSSTARSATGEAIPRGELVQIERIVGPQVLVRPLLPPQEKSE
jgi:membrane protein implicated in regulation of membrane protease activity